MHFVGKSKYHIIWDMNIHNFNYQSQTNQGVWEAPSKKWGFWSYHQIEFVKQNIWTFVRLTAISGRIDIRPKRSDLIKTGTA